MAFFLTGSTISLVTSCFLELQAFPVKDLSRSSSTENTETSSPLANFAALLPEECVIEESWCFGIATPFPRSIYKWNKCIRP